MNKNIVYLDNAATTYPKPPAVLKAAQEAITIYGGNPGRSGHKMSMNISEKIYKTRENFSEFFCCEPQNVVFTQNCTMALNIAIKGLFNDGGHVLCSCIEHNSVIRPLFKLKEQGKIEYEVVEISNSDDEIINSFASKITCETKGIICTHASNVSGRIMPIERLGKLCSDHGLYFVVDAAQSSGVIPVNMEKYNINALCMPGHKGIYGITGSGVLLLRNCDNIQSLMEGGTGSVSSEPEQPNFLPDSLEAGTANTVGILCMDAGLNFVKKLTLNRIYHHEIKICTMVYQELSSIDNIRLYQHNYKEGNYLPIISFNIGNTSSETVVNMLNEKNFALRGGLHCAPLAHKYYGTTNNGMVRFSPSVFTNESEVDQFLKNIHIISKKIPN